MKREKNKEKGASLEKQGVTPGDGLAIKDGDLINIGKIAGSFGVEGWVKVIPLTDFPERFQKMKTVKLSHAGMVRDVKVEGARPHKGFYLIKLQGIESPEEAVKYRNALLQIDESQLYPLPEGSYYHFQLEGLEVYDAQRGFLGRLTEVLATGANDVYVIQTEQYGEVLIPAIKDVVLRVDLSAGKMEINLLPGLLDD
ncbi:ribosome maturation factor RimM [Syntrophomonas palmitatica]|uniref:ribosome maturation factor RimM n=1 Tax=Syntrophomonas palmitatica TaxID=402877 RepID=UPI0009FA39C9|nr:ribosome maturation factor RimM [Syntrophomonas palmitatica]